MERINPIDCERFVPNRFEIVLLAAARARALNRGDTPLVPAEGDAPVVIALREIATGAIDRSWLQQWLLARAEDALDKKDAEQDSCQLPFDSRRSDS